MQVYKLTKQNNTTYNNTLWGENVTHETNGIGVLCGSGWLHFYTNPYLAILLNPVHADIRNPKLWNAEAEGTIQYDHGLKGGCTKLTTVKEIEIPVLTTEQKQLFSIMCAKKVFTGDEEWNKWASDWIEHVDRSREAASKIAYRLDFKHICLSRAVNAAYSACSVISSVYDSEPYIGYFVADAIRYAGGQSDIDFEEMIKEMFAKTN